MLESQEELLRTLDMRDFAITIDRVRIFGRVSANCFHAGEVIMHTGRWANLPMIDPSIQVFFAAHNLVAPIPSLPAPTEPYRIIQLKTTLSSCVSWILANDPQQRAHYIQQIDKIIPLSPLTLHTSLTTFLLRDVPRRDQALQILKLVEAAAHLSLGMLNTMDADVETYFIEQLSTARILDLYLDESAIG